MHPLTLYLLGFASGALPLAALILIYYVRAKRRVKEIKSSILRYQLAQKTVGKACDTVFGKQCHKPQQEEGCKLASHPQ